MTDGVLKRGDVWCCLLLFSQINSTTCEPKENTDGAVEMYRSTQPLE